VGNAVAAGVGVGVYKNYEVVKHWVKLGAKSVPNPERHDRYMRLYAVFRDLYPALKDQFVRLAEALETPPNETAVPPAVQTYPNILPTKAQ
jgi:xylulokinase